MSLFSCCKPIVAPAKTPASEDSGPADGLRHSSSFLDADLHRTKSESRILQAPLPVSPDGKSLSSSARSLFEASAYRVAAHEYREKIKQNQPDTDNGGLPARFLELYLTALKAGNTK